MQVNATAFGSFPVNAALGPYLRVVNSSGYLALAGASDREFGVTRKRVLVTGVGAEDEASVTLRNAYGTHKMIAADAIALFGKVYGAAAGKVSATANGNFIGWNVGAASTADGDEIEVLRADEGPELLYSNVAASAAHTNTVTAADFDKSVTIPANTLKAGDVLRIRGQVIATATNSTDTLTLLLTIGGTTIVTSGAVDVANGDIGYFDAVVNIRTIGASGTMVATGVVALGVPGTVTAKPFLLGSTAIDTTAALAIAINADWSVADAGNSCRLDILDVERLAA